MLALIATALLTLALLGGATLAALHLRRARVPFAAGLAHGGLALAGIVVLAAAVWQATQPKAVNAALLCLGLALVGGVFVLLFRLGGEPPPGFMIGLHAAAALLGVVLLWIGIA